jgi:hypothetical protein
VAHVDDLQGGDGLGEVDTAAVQAGELAEAQASAEQGQGAALAKGGRADLGGQVALPAAHVGGADGLDRAVTEPGPHVQPQPALGDGQGVGLRRVGSAR